MERRVAIALGCLLALLVWHLVFGPDPWNDGVARALERGRAVRPVDYATTYGWWVAALNAVVVAVLLVTRRFWIGGSGVAPHARSGGAAAAHADKARRGERRWFAALVAGAMIAAAFLAVPRLDDSLWGDEEWTVRKGIDGAYFADASGAIVWDQVLWHETFFYYRRPSNHVGYTVPARLSLAGWRSLADPETRFVSETAVRLPAFLAGLGAIATVALLLRAMGLPMAGAFAAWALALHPWFLRYASEARGYALLMCLCPLALLALWRALDRGTWPRWALYGFVQFWMLWTWPPAGIFLGFVNLAAAGCLWQAHRRGGQGRDPWLRWIIASAMGGMLFLQLMAGNLVQLSNFRDHYSSAGGADWFAHLGGHFIAAVRWGPDLPQYVEIADLIARSPRLFWAWLGVSVVAITWGAGSLLLGRGRRSWFALALILPGPALLLYAELRGVRLNPWFLIHLLPSVVVLLAVGLESVARALAPRRMASVVCAGVLLAWVGAFGFLTAPSVSSLREGSLQPMRESVLLTRPTLDPHAPENEKILTAAIARGPTYYDPRFVFVEKTDALEALIRRAEAEGLPLYVNSGRPGLAEGRVPALVEMVERSGRFEQVAILHGFEPRGERRIYRYRGRP